MAEDEPGRRKKLDFGAKRQINKTKCAGERERERKRERKRRGGRKVRIWWHMLEMSKSRVFASATEEPVACC
jgi:hypothetical protein